jgi:hypothetical protein
LETFRLVQLTLDPPSAFTSLVYFQLVPRESLT